MANAIKINGDTYIPTENIKFVRPLTADDQARISAYYGTDKRPFDGTQFNTQINVTNSDKPILTRETADELSTMGLALVNLGNGKLVPANNIISTRKLDKAGCDALKDKGYNLEGIFRSSVDTTGGLMLSKGTPEQILQRREKALSILSEAKTSAPVAEVEEQHNDKGVA